LRDSLLENHQVVSDLIADINRVYNNKTKAYGLFHVYLKEGLPAIIRASAVSIISLIGLTTMAGAVGAGGLGTLAVKKGHEGFKDDISIVCTLIILVLVFFTQWVCNVLIKKVSH